jgi:serine O-acetyltransferase
MKHQMIVEALLDSYLDTPIRKEHCACRLPSNKAMKEIVTLTKRLLFPGYFSMSGKGEDETEHETTRLVKRLQSKLGRQIGDALLYIADKHKCKTITTQARSLAEQYLVALPSVRVLLQTDLNAHYEGDPAAFYKDIIVVAYPGFYAIVIYRLAHVLHQLGVPILPRMMTEFGHRETGIDIGAGATIGEAFFIDHGTGVVIGETAVIGNRVKIYQGVTIGAMSTSGGRKLVGVKRHPTIGDDVTIYAGASILGGETVIGSRSTIGSNAFLTESVEPDSRVSMKPGELLVRNKKGIGA